MTEGRAKLTLYDLHIMLTEINLQYWHLIHEAEIRHSDEADDLRKRKERWNETVANILTHVFVEVAALKMMGDTYNKEQ